MSGFLKLINLWSIRSNSKQKYNANFRIDDAAVEGDNKPCEHLSHRGPS